MGSLVDWLRPEAIALDVAVGGWEDAVRQAGGLLEAVGAIDSEYTDAMVNSIFRNGPYIVLEPGFAFAHARPSEFVHRAALSWLRPATPVRFGHRHNDPVELVVAMAVNDSTQHQVAISQLAHLISDARTMDRLRSARTPVEVISVLSEVAGPATRVGHHRLPHWPHRR
ncbi:PTS sugar transporter subunit IIA [Luteococcus sanguinis]|uniref:Ascorbate-specific PTS system EIIA component n=1 Tax=Luteococcus sanguinis TaxID=174038 RepID=A0ABW1X0W9_9ACTN